MIPVARGVSEWGRDKKRHLFLQIELNRFQSAESRANLAQMEKGENLGRTSRFMGIFFLSLQS